ncbi:MAG: U32 family peptidase [Eubacterium sp.]|nr:U32 family peptidase [Eubacterium sp.]
MEILAPCGSTESVTAAVRCKADAVYLGAKGLNARRNAENFEYTELKEAVRYCHERGVKVYLTVNTLVSDSEMKEAYDTVDEAMKAGIDAFIVQDLGLAKMIKACFPEARLHASTQCSVNTPEGFKALEELGFERAVIPREMSLDEIYEIRKATSMELEAFVHGALCMCVSGQCYLSAFLGSRSGNRGLCAQPCRLPFSADSSGTCDLSLKDLSLISRVKELEKAGICSLKIEGRMKRPEYVAAAVTACKNSLDGNYSEAEEDRLQKVFSRSGFTDAYLTGKRNDMFGTRTKDDVISASEVLKELRQLYKNEAALIGVEFDFICKKNEPVSLIAKTDTKTVSVTGMTPEKAINRELSEEELINRLSKLGSTPYFIKDIHITLDGGLSLAASKINRLRRSAVEALSPEEDKKYIKLPLNTIPPSKKAEEKYYTARFSDASQIPENHPFKRIFLPVYADSNDLLKHGAGVEIPRGLFGYEDKLKTRLTQLKALGIKTALCSNLGAYKTAKELGYEVFGDFGLNVFNSESASYFNSPVLSFELSSKQINALSKEDAGIIAYGKLPLMLTRNCPVKNNIGCEKCNKNGYLTDRKGYKFPVKCSPFPCVEMLNSVPLNISDRQEEFGCAFFHFYFTDESNNEVKRIINSFKNKTAPEGEFTRGLYFRGVK